MTEYRAPLAEFRFVQTLFGAADDWAARPEEAALTPDLVDAILEEAGRIVSAELTPLNRTGDVEGCRFSAGAVTTPTGFKAALAQLAAGGWCGLAGSVEQGGQGLPRLLTLAVDEMLFAANTSLALYLSLNNGAALLLESCADEALKARYLPRLLAGEWLGTMCLTEPHCGTDLGLIKTRAVPNDDGSYAITGSKVWITGGEHDLTENILHLVLAKLPDAPAGSRGISLFAVPKRHVGTDGILGEPNGVVCGGLEHKMGIKGSATCVMHFDSARGELIGAPHQGLAAMFTMMNEERLSIGLQGLGLGEAAYQNAMAFARERLQSRGPGGAVAPEKIADPILVHPDVRRMALNVRAWNEGGRLFAAFIACELDRARWHTDAHTRTRSEEAVALLTPVAKAFLTERGFEATVEAQQLFGGSGYCVEWGAEQFVRDARIAMIYEGTNGIQAMDLVGRKLARDDGAMLGRFIQRMRNSLAEPDCAAIDPRYRAQLEQELARLERTTQHLLQRAKDDPAALGAAAHDTLQLLALTVYAWLWARASQSAMAGLEQGGALGEAFYREKLIVARHFFERQLPRSLALERQLASGAEGLMAMPIEGF
ncbi:acyl-CoA dehydrogenase C-terminal domain-containing protein [Salinicola rhizosphaerae]|uniref:Acyl-CoA dehydrogenase n=1 Tax=Salinicola rhizosphaerae TaxID=1443141 RepID=A0ABQ3E3E7_9GAMM|nr:acyl-CoA dehydrogenase C-terminal domain-containing protein [Salinicola rhizosphaerae]GHB23613.1 acyl-CoA dehydrogenase [Salinicola rhizosphaerae]